MVAVVLDGCAADLEDVTVDECSTAFFGEVCCDGVFEGGFGFRRSWLPEPFPASSAPSALHRPVALRLDAMDAEPAEERQTAGAHAVIHPRQLHGQSMRIPAAPLSATTDVDRLTSRHPWVACSRLRFLSRWSLMLAGLRGWRLRGGARHVR